MKREWEFKNILHKQAVGTGQLSNFNKQSNEIEGERRNLLHQQTVATGQLTKKQRTPAVVVPLVVVSPVVVVPVNSVVVPQTLQPWKAK